MTFLSRKLSIKNKNENLFYEILNNHKLKIRKNYRRLLDFVGHCWSK